MSAERVRLHPDDVEAIARRVADLLRDEPLRPADRLLSAADVARRIGRSRDFVYDHSADLGAVRLGDGARPRLAFDPGAVDAWLSARPRSGGSPSRESGATPRIPTSRPRPLSGKGAGLLPVRTLNYPESEEVAGRRGNAPGPATRRGPSPRDERTPPGGASSPDDRPASSTPTTRGGR